jgi:hypothetical protein
MGYARLPQIQFDAEKAIQDSISSLEEQVLTEAVLEHAGTAPKVGPEDRNISGGCVERCAVARDWWLRVEVGTWARAGRDSMHTHHALPSRPLPCTCVALLATYRRSRACCERCALSLSTIKQR